VFTGSIDYLCWRSGKVSGGKGIMVLREPLEPPAQRNEVWSIGFVMDALFNGRRSKILAVGNDCAKELVDLVVDFCISGRYVTRILD